MNGKQIITFFLAAVLCLGLLPACGSTQPAQTPAGITATTTAATEAPTTVPETTAPEVTEATQPEATEPKNDAELLKENQKKINTFLSNFAEQSLGEYPTTDLALLDFGYMYCKINATSKLHVDMDRECYYVKKKDMDTILRDFFGKEIKPNSDYEVLSGNGWDQITFNKDRYEFPLADGLLTEYVAIVDSMKDNGNGTYTAEFDVYYMEGDISNVYYSYTAAKAAKSDDLSWEYSGKAIVKDHTRSNGKESYLLIKYMLD